MAFLRVRPSIVLQVAQFMVSPVGCVRIVVGLYVSTGRLSTLLARFKLVPDSIVCCVRRRANTTMLAFGVGHSTHTANNKIWYKLKHSE